MLLLLFMLSDEDSFAKIVWLFEKYHGKMLRYARYLLKYRGDKNYLNNAEDVVQEAFYRGVKYIDRIDFTMPEAAIGGYLFTIVEHEADRFLSKSHVTEELDEKLIICEECDHFEELSRKEMYGKAVEEIKRLNPKYRTVIEMRFLNEMSVDEIADALSIPQKTVYTRIARGLKIIKNKLEGNE